MQICSHTSVSQLVLIISTHCTEVVSACVRELCGRDQLAHISSLHQRLGHLYEQLRLTSDVIFGAVQHVGCVDELVTRTSNSQLRLRVPQNYFTPESPTCQGINSKQC